jgi:putative FmdB family regulatory protein
MPVYEYRCTSCQNVFEYQHRMSDPPKTVCESCSGPLERLISRSAFQFKGGGWYKDLYSSAKPGAEAAPAKSTESKPSSDGASSSSGSSDAGSSSSGSSSSSSSSSGTTGSSGSGSTPSSGGGGSAGSAAAGPAK